MIRAAAMASLLALAALSWTDLADGAATPSASATLSLALRDAAQHSSFRTTDSSVLLGHGYASTADVGPEEGQQRISISPGGQARVVVVGGVAYIAGNQAGLIHYFGFPAAAARKAGSRWVSIRSSSPGYAPASQNVLRGSVLTYLTPSGRLAETAPTRIDGTAVIGIAGAGPTLRSSGAASSLTLFVSKAGAPLPVRAVLSDKQGDHESITLGSWNEHVALKAPRGAIAIGTLAASQ
jgi:hypothetical protein